MSISSVADTRDVSAGHLADANGFFRDLSVVFVLVNISDYQPTLQGTSGMNSQELFVAAGGQKTEPRGPGSILCAVEDSETLRGQPAQKFLLFGKIDHLSLIHMSTRHHGEQTPQMNRNSGFPPAAHSTQTFMLSASQTGPCSLFKVDY